MFARGLAAGGEDRVLFLAGNIGRGALAVSVEKTRHFRREQHRCSAPRRLFDLVHQRCGIGPRVDAGVRLEERDAGHPNSSSRPPARSSANRSSHPPIWRSPMKICGTVIRPFARWIIVSFSGPPKSTTISLYSTPLVSRRCFARQQYPQVVFT